MIMVQVFSALFGRECDMVGRVHDSIIDDGILPDFLRRCVRRTH